MRTRTLILILAALGLMQAGCAAGFHVGGEQRGLGAGARIGSPPPSYSTSPPPVYPVPAR
ncbi:MAG: hypothetical protein JO112_05150 [Planctomycetes bacterium]|nr:hypothetical protein [Planctomycetota bacterium]